MIRHAPRPKKMVFASFVTKYYDAALLQGFEKMISGMYLGDIARRVLYRIAQDSDIFGDAAASLSVPFLLRYTLLYCYKLQALNFFLLQTCS